MSLGPEPDEERGGTEGKFPHLPAALPQALSSTSSAFVQGAFLGESLRGEVTALLTSTELLVEDFDSLPTPAMWERLAVLHRHAFSLHHLVENLLCAIAIDEGEFHLHRKAVDLADLVSAVQTVVAPLLGRRRQRIQLLSAGSIEELSLDPRRISQAIVNLIANASAFSAQDDLIELGLTTRGAVARLEVGDRGSAANGSETRLLSYPAQIRESVRAGDGDLPLSLAIVRAIIEAHGGTVGARARRRGGGCFWFELPWTPP